MTGSSSPWRAASSPIAARVSVTERRVEHSRECRGDHDPAGELEAFLEPGPKTVRRLDPMLFEELREDAEPFAEHCGDEQTEADELISLRARRRHPRGPDEQERSGDEHREVDEDPDPRAHGLGEPELGADPVPEPLMELHEVVE